MREAEMMKEMILARVSERPHQIVELMMNISGDGTEFLFDEAVIPV
jgi:hypothetical protein